MNPILGAIENTIPFSLFNKGMAGKSLKRPNDAAQKS